MSRQSAERAVLGERLEIHRRTLWRAAAIANLAADAARQVDPIEGKLTQLQAQNLEQCLRFVAELTYEVSGNLEPAIILGAQNEGVQS